MIRTISKITKAFAMTLISIAAGANLLQGCGTLGGYYTGYDLETAMQLSDDYWASMERANDNWLDYIQM